METVPVLGKRADQQEAVLGIYRNRPFIFYISQRFYLCSQFSRSSTRCWSLPTPGGGLAAFLPLIMILPVAVSSAVISIKRLHDLNRSGWWYFIALAAFLGASFGDAFVYVGFGLSLVALVGFGFIRGTVGPNQYGPDPLASSEQPDTDT